MPYPIDPLASNLYTLTAYQSAFMLPSATGPGVYIDIWGIDPDAGNSTSYDASDGDVAGNVVKLYTNVPACLQPTQEFDQFSPVGLGEVTNLDTLDRIKLHSSQPAQNGQFFVVTTSGPWLDLWWALQGNAQANAHPLFLVSRYNCKRTHTPPVGWQASGTISNQPSAGVLVP